MPDPASARMRSRRPGSGSTIGGMSDHTYRVTEIVGSSTEGTDAAIRNGIARAAETLRRLDWFEVTQVRGHIVDGQVQHYQVGMKVGFRLE
jgi:flavin-binding protein dodecin